ncbi:hypothetical protein CAPTEDRAFT_199165 [Capitella teleta]|uniref:Uncharacterized protein n=1 Tax=Capitella teleta TaxID=283909 RepID=R7VJR5_CAPTE|nr:hypothetical protein CAPTEDRAFT_199165 [Capitella teleta]|eukprot:ELU16701.1 hypothetical protein CAPTEDRAFT_199165 [Capitella teleta]
MVTGLCDKIGFSTKPVDVKRIGKKIGIVYVSFNSNFDARAFCAQYHSAKKNDENIPVIRLWLGKTKTEQDAFKRNNDLVYKMNQKANKEDAGRILAVCETWLSTNIDDNEIIPVCFTVYRKDRCETQPLKRVDGILLAITADITSKRRMDLESDIEIIVCQILCNKRSKVAIVLLYRSPSSDVTSFNVSLASTLDNVSTVVLGSPAILHSAISEIRLLCEINRSTFATLGGFLAVIGLPGR